LWKNIFKLRNRLDRAINEVRSRSAENFILSEIPLRFPRFLLILFFLLVYFVAIKVLFIRLEAAKGSISRHISILSLIILVFSASSFFWIYKGQNRTNSTYSSFSYLRMLDGQDQLLGRTVLGIHSLKTARYNLEFGTHPYAVALINNDAEKNSSYPIMLNYRHRQGRTISIPIDRWARRFFQIDFVRKFQLSGNARLETQGLIVTLENTTDEEIIDCQMLYRGKLYKFGDLSAGEKQVRQFLPEVLKQKLPLETHILDSHSHTRKPDNTTALLTKIKYYTQRDLLISLKARRDVSTESIRFFGWIKSDGLPETNITPGTRGESVSLLEMTIPVDVNSKI